MTAARTTLDDLVRAARAHVRRKWGRTDPAGLRLVLEFLPGDLAEDRLELTPVGGEVPGPFVPTELQKDILTALAGRAFRSDALAREVGVDKSRLYADPGGLPELQEEGLVRHHKRVGYWSAEAPPADLPVGL